jgi:hypothetical protein
MNGEGHLSRQAGDGETPERSLGLPPAGRESETVTDAGSDEASRRRLPAVSALLGPFVIGVLFFCVLTPFGLVMRRAGRDRLRLGRDRSLPSYWVARARSAGRQTSMTRQY